MMLAVQPDILNSVMKNRSMRGRGLNARFLYAICESRVGSRDFIGADISEKTLSNYNNFVFTALNTKVNGGELYFGADARAELADFSSWIERRLASDLRPMQDWGGKLVGAICRIAALIHCGELVGSDASFYPIMLDTLLKAESMTEFLVSHALGAYGSLGCDVAADDARYGHLTVKAVGESVGYRSHATFVNMFKKTTGLTPSLYQKMARTNGGMDK